MCNALSVRLFKFACLLVLTASSTGAIFGQARGPQPLRSITISTEPNATVWIDGVRYGVTGGDGKLKVTSVLPGMRSIRVRADGYAEVTKSIPATTRGEVSVALAKTTDEAELAFQSAESLTTVDREKAIAAYQRGLDADPVIESFYQGLMRCYQRLDRRTEAISAYRRLKQILSVTLGLTPSPATERLYQGLR